MVNKIAACIDIGRRVAARLLPLYCELCAAPSQRDIALCSACEADLRRNERCCRRCALPLVQDFDNALCPACQRRTPAFDHCYAPFIYTEPLAGLITRFKFFGDLRIAPLLGSLLCRDLPPPRPGPRPSLIPVPLHWRRLWQRGFNQAELLCLALVQADPTLRCNSRLCRRVRATAAQSSLGRGQRRKNMRSAFVALEPCRGASFIVVDDVMTSGSTADAVATALKLRGAKTVDLWCLARTPGH